MELVAPGLPESYLTAIKPLVQSALKLLEEGAQLQPFAFVGNFTTRQVLGIEVDTFSESTKDAACNAIRVAALAVEADFIFLIMESWALKSDKAANYEAIIEKYGSIGASPYRQDVLCLTLETRYGTWMGMPSIMAKGLSKKKRTIPDVELSRTDSMAGRFYHLLPTKDEPAPPIH
jgi:hypothetical protein